MKFWTRTREMHMWLMIFLGLVSLFSIVYVGAQKYIGVKLKILSSFNTEFQLNTGNLLYINGEYFTNTQAISVTVTANDSSSYVLYGDVFAPLNSFDRTGAYSDTVVVHLLSGSGVKDTFLTISRNTTGYTDVRDLGPETVFLDQEGPTAPILTSPISDLLVYSTTRFQREAAIDSGVWVKEYQYLIASDTWFLNLELVDTTQHTYFSMDTTALAPWKYYWEVLAVDYFGYTTVSSIESFIVDHPWNWWIRPPVTEGGGTTRWYTLYDNCPNGDFSPSYYDGVCSASDWVNAHNAAWTTCKWAAIYGEELCLAYEYAYDNGITSLWSIGIAELFKPLVRKEYAKMVTQFAVNILWLKPDINKDCTFDDVEDESEEFKYFMKTACELGLMGLEYDGVPAKSFWPNLPVSRAMFWTVLSRLLFGSVYNGNSDSWFQDHLLALKKANIMQMIDAPLTPELRWYAMLMLKRSDEYGYADIHAFRTSQRRRN